MVLLAPLKKKTNTLRQKQNNTVTMRIKQLHQIYRPSARSLMLIVFFVSPFDRMIYSFDGFFCSCCRCRFIICSFVVAILLRDTLPYSFFASRHSLPLELRIFVRKNTVHEILKNVAQRAQASFQIWLSLQKRQKGKTTNNTSFIFIPITIVIIKEQQQDKIDDNSNHNHHHYHQSLAIPIVPFESEASTAICNFGNNSNT